MNPGPTEEVGKAANNIIDALKKEPLSLALVLMNLALLGLFYIIATTLATQREREIGLLYADQKEIRTMLSKCIVPDGPTP